MFLGIDLGTSSVKALLVDAEQRVVAQASAPLRVDRPRPHWSEQDPVSWWAAASHAVERVRREAPVALGAVQGIGLSGQMHGATLLDAAGRVLRPAILWNDGRSAPQCASLERREPRSRAITGNLAMPGFTAPKLLWVAEHEPEVFRRTAMVLLPKDYLRLCLTGECVSEPSDAAGTLWLDVAARAWSPELLAATGLSIDNVPRLVEGSAPSARVRAAVAAEWGLPPGVVVAGGGGDNAAGAIGVGVVRSGQALLSLGTSGVYFVADGAFRPNPASAVHAFCHCVPRTWHQMSVVLSAASCLSWLASCTGAESEAALLAETEAAGVEPRAAREVVFLPYLSGERTPHNDPDATGVFFGLTGGTTRADLCRAVLEGVAFALADGQDALLAAGTSIGDVAVIGGGARSRAWGRILATALGRSLRYPADGEVGPAFGAARLARLAVTNEPVEAVCTAPGAAWVAEPEGAWRAAYAERQARFRELYGALRATFARAARGAPE